LCRKITSTPWPSTPLTRRHKQALNALLLSAIQQPAVACLPDTFHRPQRQVRSCLKQNLITVCSSTQRHAHDHPRPELPRPSSCIVLLTASATASPLCMTRCQCVAPGPSHPARFPATGQTFPCPWPSARIDAASSVIAAGRTAPISHVLPLPGLDGSRVACRDTTSTCNT
jgi:hypothetical protein